MVVCTPGTLGTSNFKGVEISLFNEIYSSFGLTENDWEFECVETEELLFQKLASDPVMYIAGFGSIKTTLKYQFAGFTYSTRPTIQTGLSILVAQKKDNWLFLRIFSFQTGAALILSAIVMGVLHYYLERREFPFEKYLWNAFTAIFFVSMVNVRTIPARIIQLSFWFIIIILLASYSAALTAIMTDDQVRLDIHNVADLKNTVIKTPQRNMGILPLYGAQPLLDERVRITHGNVLRDLETDFIDGYALDDPSAQILARQSCGLSKRIKLFHPYGFVLAFGIGTSEGVVESVNNALQEALENKSSSERIEDYIVNVLELGTKCAGKSSIQTNKMKISDFIELIIILSAGLGLGIFFHFLSKTKGYKRMQRVLMASNVISPNSDNPEAPKKYGDELIITNLRQVTNNCVKTLEGTINERLDEMEDRVTKFYETLLHNQGNPDFSYSRDHFQFDDSKFFQEESTFKPSVDNNNYADRFDDMKDEIPGEDVIPFQSPTRSLLKNTERLGSATKRKKSE